MDDRIQGLESDNISQVSSCFVNQRTRSRSRKGVTTGNGRCTRRIDIHKESSQHALQTVDCSLAENKSSLGTKNDHRLVGFFVWHCPHLEQILSFYRRDEKRAKNALFNARQTVGFAEHCAECVTATRFRHFYRGRSKLLPFQAQRDISNEQSFLLLSNNEKIVKEIRYIEF